MKRTTLAGARSLLVALCLFSQGIAFADAERWYRVELLVFTHQSAGTEGDEQWDASPSLVYPEHGRFLLDTKRIAEKLELFDADSTVDAFGHQTLTIIRAPEALEDIDASQIDASQTEDASLPIVVSLTPLSDPNQPTAPDDPNEAGKVDELLQDEVALTPTPFVQLAHSELEFRGKAAYMQRTGRYQTLFHEAWVQPMVDKENTASIILDRSGDQKDWPRLQGSVKIFLSRYLHIETELWLNTDGRYLPPGWNMPPPPLGPESLTIIYPPEPVPDPNAPVLVIEDYFPVGEAKLAVDLELDDEVDLQPSYPWRHAVLLQQSRRMRSKEVHYIDHPMLGLVVKISPLSEEELQQRAEQEAALLPIQASSPL